MSLRLTISALLCASFVSAQEPVIEKGSFKLHLILHAIGEETFEVRRSAEGGHLVMNSSSEFSDCGRPTARKSRSMLKRA